MIEALLVMAFFVAGPATLVFLVRLKRPQSFYRNMAITAAILTIAAFMIGNNENPNPSMNGFVLFAFWLAWVLTLAVCVQAICVRFPFGGFPQWSTAIGAMATTIPWLGYAAATIMVK